MYARTSDLVEALLAYEIAISDVDTDTSQLNLQQPPPPLQHPPLAQPPSTPSQQPPSQPSSTPSQPPPSQPPQTPSPLAQQQQQQQEVQSAEAPTSSLSQDQHVGCDVTDDASTSVVTCRRRELHFH